MLATAPFAFSEGISAAGTIEWRKIVASGEISPTVISAISASGASPDVEQFRLLQHRSRKAESQHHRCSDLVAVHAQHFRDLCSDD